MTNKCVGATDTFFSSDEQGFQLSAFYHKSKSFGVLSSDQSVASTMNKRDYQITEFVIFQQMCYQHVLFDLLLNGREIS